MPTLTLLAAGLGRTPGIAAVLRPGELVGGTEASYAESCLGPHGDMLIARFR